MNWIILLYYHFYIIRLIAIEILIIELKIKSSTLILFIT